MKAGSESDARWAQQEERMALTETRVLEAAWKQPGAVKRRRKQPQGRGEQPAGGELRQCRSRSLPPWSPLARCPAARAGRSAGRRCRIAPPPSAKPAPQRRMTATQRCWRHCRSPALPALQKWDERKMSRQQTGLSQQAVGRLASWWRTTSRSWLQRRLCLQQLQLSVAEAQARRRRREQRAQQDSGHRIGRRKEQQET